MVSRSFDVEVSPCNAVSKKRLIPLTQVCLYVVAAPV